MALLPKNKIIEVQEGGAGANNWKVLGIANDITRGIFDTPSGGGVEYTQQFGRNHKKNAQLQAIDQVQTGQPSPHTFNVELPFDDLNWLLQMYGKKNLRVRWYSGDYTNPINFQRLAKYINCVTAGDEAFTQALVNDAENIGDPQRIQLPQQALNRVYINPVSHARLTSGVTIAYNKVHAHGFQRNAGDIPGENQNKTGDEEFLFAADRSAGGAAPYIAFTTDKGATITPRLITPAINDLDLLDICKAGPNIVACGPAASVGGVVWVKYDDFVANSFTVVRSTGISAGTAINRVIAITSTLVLACGNAGIAYISRDSGVSFTSLGTAVTANNLTEIAFADENLAWFGGASGTLVKWYNGVMSVVPVNGLSTTAITALAVPPGRGYEVYIGSAAGNIHATPNALLTTPVFSTRSFPNVGVGSIDDIQFAGAEGNVMWVVQTNGSSQSRVLRDDSGGMMGADTQIIGDFTSPANSVINSIAPSSENHALTAGEPNGGSGFAGRVN